MQPAKHPRLYMETMIPIKLSPGLPMVSRKSSFSTIPEKTPWSYPARVNNPIHEASSAIESITEENKRHSTSCPNGSLEGEPRAKQIDLHHCASRYRVGLIWG